MKVSKFARALGAGTLLVVAMHTTAADDWYPSKWGKDDTLGSVNEITPESIVAAAKLVKTGKRYALGMVTSRSTPAFGSRTLRRASLCGLFRRIDRGEEPYEH